MSASLEAVHRKAARCLMLETAGAARKGAASLQTVYKEDEYMRSCAVMLLHWACLGSLLQNQIHLTFGK